jgi:hypothetical protein
VFEGVKRLLRQLVGGCKLLSRLGEYIARLAWSGTGGLWARRCLGNFWPMALHGSITLQVRPGAGFFWLPRLGSGLRTQSGTPVATTRKMAMGVDRWKTVDCVVSGADRKDLPRLWLNYAMEAWKAVWLDSASVGPLGPTTTPRDDNSKNGALFHS